MFYLLEDNRIIDSENTDVYVNEYQNCKWLHRNNKHKYCLGKIKKQSENVYSLIDWDNDLVKTKDGYIISCKSLYIFYMQEYIEKQFFTAIYKPNANGDYIKVWERKEE